MASLGEIVDEALRLAESLAQHKGVQLAIERAALPDFIETDGPRLRQVFLQMLSCSIRYTGSKAVGVRLKLLNREGRPWLRLSTPHTDTMLSEDDINNFVEKPLDSGARESFRLGISLFTCKRLVTLLGGELHVKRKRGRSSSLALTLPLFVAPVHRCLLA